MTEQSEEINTNETDEKPFSIPGVIHWIEVAKRDKEIQSSKGPKMLDVCDAPTFHPDGSVSFPKGLCLKEWPDFKNSFKSGYASNKMFVKHIIGKALSLDFNDPKTIIPTEIKRQLPSIAGVFSYLLEKEKKKCKINDYEVG